MEGNGDSQVSSYGMLCVFVCQMYARIFYTDMSESNPTPVVTSGRSTARQASQLPLTRVKNIIKSDPDITLASQEATLVISKVGFLLLAITMKY